MKKRPTSAVGYKRPICQQARDATAMGPHFRYRVGVCVYVCDPRGCAARAALMSLVCVQAENIILLDLDMTPARVASLRRSAAVEPNQSRSVDSSPTKDRRVRKSQSW